MRRSLLGYIFQLLLTKLKPADIRHLLWQKRRYHLFITTFEKQGFAVVHPSTSLAKGVIADQIVEVTVTYRTWQNVYRQTSRLMRLSLSISIPADYVQIGRNDAYNMFGGVPGTDFIVDSIKSYNSLPNSEKTLATTEAVRLARIKQHEETPKDDFSEELQEIFEIPRVVYNNDIVCIPVRDIFTEEISRHYFKIDCDESPCILDTTSSFYQISSVSSNLPYAAQPQMFAIPEKMSATVERMRNIVLAHDEVEENPLVLLLFGAAGSGKRLVATHLAIKTHRNLIEMSCYDIWSEVTSQSEEKLNKLFEKAASFQPCILHLTSIDVFAYDVATNTTDPRMMAALRVWLEKPAQITVIFSCNSDKVCQLSSTLQSLVLYDFMIEHLDEDARLIFLSSWLTFELATYAARNTAGFVIAELINLIRDVHFRITTQKVDRPEISHVEWAIDKRNASFADAIGAPKIPSVSWDDVGGLEETKRTVIESIESNLHGTGLKRSGVIFFGPPGCGKTLIAKAVATEFKIAFLNVKGPELLNKYVGQSEENLRKVFERARQASPCVIFFDELDSLAPSRGRSGDSGGVADRIVSQLLAELDSLHQSPHIKVFVMAATNRADLLDPALLTPGRFDKIIEVKPGTDLESKVKILEAVTRKLHLAKDVDLHAVAEKCGEIATGAEMYGLVSAVVLEAIREQIHLIEAGHAVPSHMKGIVTQAHFEAALEKKRLEKRPTIKSASYAY
ncbi:unnamed protein product [Cylicocyclus nassatus]|uniref:Peroxisomal ATPase PEX6 n=1 Tax=Cylicocyclus nassatus TaxID=53992 RepID=A0AA36DMR1_CYLNA|nr:unnamed protein product [Cylicocyclus nassatus]